MAFISKQFEYKTTHLSFEGLRVSKRRWTVSTVKATLESFTKASCTSITGCVYVQFELVLETKTSILLFAVMTKRIFCNLFYHNGSLCSFRLENITTYGFDISLTFASNPEIICIHWLLCIPTLISILLSRVCPPTLCLSRLCPH